MIKYCKCEGGLIVANLKTGKGKCPICGFPKKLSKRLNTMSQMHKSTVLTGDFDKINKRLKQLDKDLLYWKKRSERGENKMVEILKTLRPKLNKKLFGNIERISHSASSRYDEESTDKQETKENDT